MPLSTQHREAMPQTGLIPAQNRNMIYKNNGALYAREEAFRLVLAANEISNTRHAPTGATKPSLELV